MAIEPTDEMVEAFGQGGLTEDGIREGLAAVLAIVKRDYRPRGAVQAEPAM
jgi:hypothetical protein